MNRGKAGVRRVLKGTAVAIAVVADSAAQAQMKADEWKVGVSIYG